MHVARKLNQSTAQHLDLSLSWQALCAAAHNPSFPMHNQQGNVTL